MKCKISSFCRLAGGFASKKTFCLRLPVLRFAGGSHEVGDAELASGWLADYSPGRRHGIELGLRHRALRPGIEPIHKVKPYCARHQHVVVTASHGTIAAVGLQLIAVKLIERLVVALNYAAVAHSGYQAIYNLLLSAHIRLEARHSTAPAIQVAIVAAYHMHNVARAVALA